ncbi:hypothetical protein B0H19DRAFT_1277547 [Mycena capillaripes]|nr:hypothetical protein B0H19DRAFT_1277547 [Mycena capillaripes]
MPPPPTSTPPTRPATISELATAAASTAAEPSPSTDLKNLLRRADAHRRAGGAYMARANSPNPTNPSGPGADSAVMVGLNLERAFIEYARAATLIVETIPGHREYGAGLTAEQRTNLTANGEDILHNLGRLKAALVERYERYMRGPGARTDAIPAFMQQQAAASTIPSTQPIRRPSQHTQAHAQVHARAQQTVADEAAQWRVQREESIRRDAAAGLASAGAYASSASTFARGAGAAAPGGPTPTYLSSASQAAVAAATRAANTDGGGPQPAAVPVSLASAASQHQQGGQAQLSAIPASFGSGNNGGSYAYPSSAGVSFPHPQVQTQTTGGSYAPSYTSNTSGSPSTYTAPSSSSVSTTYPTTLGTPQSIAYTHSNASSMHSTTPYPGPMPLRPPGASSYDWEWDSASGTDDDRCVLSFFL